MLAASSSCTPPQAHEFLCCRHARHKRLLGKIHSHLWSPARMGCVSFDLRRCGILEALTTEPLKSVPFSWKPPGSRRFTPRSGGRRHPPSRRWPRAQSAKMFALCGGKRLRIHACPAFFAIRAACAQISLRIWVQYKFQEVKAQGLKILVPLS